MALVRSRSASSRRGCRWRWPAAERSPGRRCRRIPGPDQARRSARPRGMGARHHRPRRAAFVDVVSQSPARPASCPTTASLSSDVLDTAPALQLREAGRRSSRRRRAHRGARALRARVRRGAMHGPHPRGPRRADHLGVKLAGLEWESHPAGERLGARPPRPRWASSARSARTRPQAQRSRRRRFGWPDRARGHLDPGGAAGPPRGGPDRGRARGRLARAARDRDPPSPAHRGARGRGAVQGRAEGLVRDASQAQPDHERNASLACAAAARLRQAGLENVACCGTSATSRTRPWSAWPLRTRRRSCTTCGT